MPLDQDLGLEIQTRRKREVFVSWARVTVDAAVLTPSIRVNTEIKSDVRTVIRGDDTAAVVFIQLGLGCTEFFPCALGKIVDRFESIGRVEGCSASSNLR
jgi:hypothetical protein